MKADFRCGYVVIVGKPNVGKSTLMNRLIGESLSITSPKPQTTRLSIKGIYNDSDRQIIFVDTPGYLNPRYEMQKRMMQQLKDSFKDADVVLFITDKSTFPTEYDNELIVLVKSAKRPAIALVNKSDLSKTKPESEITTALRDGFEEVLFVSATEGDNLDKIIPSVTRYLPYNPPFYDTEQLSDMPMRFFAQEIIREGIFHLFEQEIPYSTAVIIDKYQESEDKTVIHSTIWLERDSQKPIIIGSKGTGLKKIREYAETKLSAFNQITTEVHLWIKVKKNWRKNNSALKEIGFHK